MKFIEGELVLEPYDDPSAESFGPGCSLPGARAELVGTDQVIVLALSVASCLELLGS